MRPLFDVDLNQNRFDKDDALKRVKLWADGERIEVIVVGPHLAGPLSIAAA